MRSQTHLASKGLEKVSSIVLPWDTAAAEIFMSLRRQGIRIGSMDLKVASIALSHDTTLLTRHTVDFGRVPGLRLANWLD